MEKWPTRITGRVESGKCPSVLCIDIEDANSRDTATLRIPCETGAEQAHVMMQGQKVHTGFIPANTEVRLPVKVYWQ